MQQVDQEGATVLLQEHKSAEIPPLPRPIDHSEESFDACSAKTERLPNFSFALHNCARGTSNARRQSWRVAPHVLGDNKESCHQEVILLVVGILFESELERQHLHGTFSAVVRKHSLWGTQRSAPEANADVPDVAPVTLALQRGNDIPDC